jgi:hypothetical protein
MSIKKTLSLGVDKIKNRERDLWKRYFKALDEGKTDVASCCLSGIELLLCKENSFK